jgi:hypothetical protein
MLMSCCEEVSWSTRSLLHGQQAALSEQDSELRVNAQAKERLLAEAEALLPVRDSGNARASYRDILDRWSAIGKVPRDAVRPLESRLRAVDNAIKAAEDERWKRSNPEGEGAG